MGSMGMRRPDGKWCPGIRHTGRHGGRGPTRGERPHRHARRTPAVRWRVSSRMWAWRCSPRPAPLLATRPGERHRLRRQVHRRDRPPGPLLAVPGAGIPSTRLLALVAAALDRPYTSPRSGARSSRVASVRASTQSSACVPVGKTPPTGQRGCHARVCAPTARASCCRSLSNTLIPRIPLGHSLSHAYSSLLAQRQEACRGRAFRRSWDL